MEQSRLTGALGGVGQGAAIGGSIGGAPGAVIGGAIGAVGGFLSGGGEDKAKDIAKKNARIAMLEADQVRTRLNLEKEVTLGRAKGSIGASNFQFTGSPRGYYNELESAFTSTQSYTRLAATLEQQIIKLGGQVAANSIKSSGLQSAFSGLTAAAGAGVFGSYTKAGGYKGPYKK